MAALKSPLMTSLDEIGKLLDRVNVEYLTLQERVGHAQHLCVVLSAENAELRQELLWLRESVKQAHEAEAPNGDD